MRRVIRAFQIEYKNPRKRSSRLVDNPWHLESAASVFSDSGRAAVAEAAGKLRIPEQVAKKESAVELAEFHMPH